MKEQEELILEPLLIQHTVNRRNLLPLWIKVFTWIFMITGGFAIFGIPAALLGFFFKVSIYGLQSTNTLSPVGLIATALLVFKGIVAYGLWTEKTWAITLGIADALLGIAVCALMMLVVPFIGDGPASLEFRLELAFLIPYLLKLLQIKPRWN